MWLEERSNAEQVFISWHTGILLSGGYLGVVLHVTDSGLI